MIVQLIKLVELEVELKFWLVFRSSFKTIVEILEGDSYSRGSFRIEACVTIEH